MMSAVSPELPVAEKTWLPKKPSGTLTEHAKDPPETGQPPEGVTSSVPKEIVADLSDGE